MLKIGVTGAAGRMGQAILRLALMDSHFAVAKVFERPDSTHQGQLATTACGLKLEPTLKIEISSESTLKGLNALIDFSSVDSSCQHAKWCGITGTPLVIGTTGFSASQKNVILESSKKVPIVLAPNMSLGANLIFALARLASKLLPNTYDMEVVEAHHRHKKDAPSGTAERLGREMAEAKGWKFDDVAVYGREGVSGERPVEQIGMHVLRMGEVVGEHSAFFSSAGETIELRHVAHSRDAFAQGALVAAKFVSQAKNGLYDMQDVLGIRAGEKA